MVAYEENNNNNIHYITPELKQNYSTIGENIITEYRKQEIQFQTDDWKINEAKIKRNEIENFINESSYKINSLNEKYDSCKRQMREISSFYEDYIIQIGTMVNDLEIMSQLKQKILNEVGLINKAVFNSN